MAGGGDGLRLGVGVGLVFEGDGSGVGAQAVLGAGGSLGHLAGDCGGFRFDVAAVICAGEGRRGGGIAVPAPGGLAVGMAGGGDGQSFQCSFVRARGIAEELAADGALPVRRCTGRGAGRWHLGNRLQRVAVRTGINRMLIQLLDLAVVQNGIVDFDLIDGSDKAISHRPALTAGSSAVFIPVRRVFKLIVAASGLPDHKIADLIQGSCSNIHFLHKFAVEVQAQLVGNPVQLTNYMIPGVNQFVAVVLIGAIIKLVVIGRSRRGNSKLLVGLFVDHTAAAVRLGCGESNGKATVHPDVLAQSASGFKGSHRAAGFVIDAQNGHTVAVFKIRIHPEADGHLAGGIDLAGKPCGIILRERKLRLLDMAAAVEVERPVFLGLLVGC